MKGVIILPKYLAVSWTPKRSANGDDFNVVKSAQGPLFYAIRDAFGFELRYTDEVNVASGTDIVVMFGVPYHNRPKLIPGLLDLDKRTKLVMYTGDVQCYDDPICLESRIKVYERCDVILSPCYEYFERMYPQFLSKFEFLPFFFSPYDRYTQLPFNDVPKMRCLLSGATSGRIYPLRSFIKKNGSKVDHKPSRYVGNAYAELLHSYFCCVTSSSIFNYAVAKYFEIPATGSLLLANEISDLKKAGFVPYRHYIPITKANVLARIDRCLKNPNDYNRIRREGMEFVHKNHSVVNRIGRLRKIFSYLMGEGERIV